MPDLATVRRYWESRSPGLTHSRAPVGSPEFFAEVERERYGDPFKYAWLPEVAEFDRHAGQRVLEVGVGLGTDILQYARAGARVSGIDLTDRAVALTRERFRQEGLEGDFRRASFTDIPWPDDTFDLVYSFGVLHHSEQTQEGIDEIHRVLRPGGRAIVMLYHRGFKYWVRKLFWYGVVHGELLHSSPQEIVNRHSETFGNCPLTRVFSRRQAARMFARFADVRMSAWRLDDYVYVGGRMVSPAQRLLPARAYRWLEDRWGWNLVIKATK